MPAVSLADRLIVAFDRGLRTLSGGTRARRSPSDPLPAEAALGEADRRRTARLMRINYSGEVCAQALYAGQAITARNPDLQALLAREAADEADHLDWCRRRLGELGGRRSLLDPLWYAGSASLGALAGALGDRWNLGFLAETEHQVVRHLDGHLGRLAANDARTRAVLSQMRNDEARHAAVAETNGAAPLPAPVRYIMKITAGVMTATTYWV